MAAIGTPDGPPHSPLQDNNIRKTNNFFSFDKNNNKFKKKHNTQSDRELSCGINNYVEPIHVAYYYY